MDFLKGKNVLVAGASGLVGTHVLKRLKDVPAARVRAVYRARPPRVKADHFECVQADLTDSDECRRAAEGMEYVVMLAADIDRRDTGLGPVLRTLAMDTQMLEAAYQAGVKKFLWLSSAVAYPDDGALLSEDRMFDKDPHDSYFALGWTIRYVEKLCQTYALKLKKPMPVAVLRPSAIYGPWADFDYATTHVLCALTRKAVERQELLEVWGTGDVRRDFIYVDDVVDACFLALKKVDVFAAMNIGLGQTYSVKELLEVVLETAKYPTARVVFDPLKAAKAPSLAIDCTLARELIGFKAKTPLREGIAQTIEWLKNAQNRLN